ncbi:hypothetical protein PCASD_14271 [Puccinia coronata f. sp. avenae]|uniref:RING-type domain-containing protein n=1 Tax=Puccinia coronata f. sp. avenae TaxID=200324 RepID=A0A2N5TF23_9BASI|nr:hypothetical protein PCASD_14271 [Puccinia coronata f. sp. avenae]
MMDDLGASIGCSKMMANGDLILADKSALNVYGPGGRGACLAYKGPKARLNMVQEIWSRQSSAQRESALGFSLFGHRPAKPSNLAAEDPDVAKSRRAKLFVHYLHKVPHLFQISPSRFSYPESKDLNQTNKALKNLEINLLQEQWAVEKAQAQLALLQMDCAQFHKRRMRADHPSSSANQVNSSIKPETRLLRVHQYNEADLDLINLYWKEIDKNRSKLTKLVNKPQIFHLNNKFAACFLLLELLVVNVMCHHSYHQRCLDQEWCVKCSEERKANEGPRANKPDLSKRCWGRDTWSSTRTFC